jgi:small subunit ribosomal protein S19e
MFDVPVNELLEEVAKDLQKTSEIKPPEWTVFVKTGVHKERPPAREDWWFIRCAAVLRSVKLSGPVGVQKLRRKYGGRKNRGHQTEHTYKGSGSIIRHVLQQLEAAQLIKKGEVGNHKGRIITPKGISLLDKAAVRIYSSGKKDTSKENKENKKQTAPDKKQDV